MKLEELTITITGDVSISTIQTISLNNRANWATFDRKLQLF